MTEPNARVIAEYWFKTLKSAPYADSWNIEDSFVEKLAATWPWIQVYFELLNKTAAEQLKEFSWISTLGVYALQETLGLRFDCAAAFFLLLMLSRASVFSQVSPEKMDQCSKVIDRLVKSENEKARTDEWLKWFEELWHGNSN